LYNKDALLTPIIAKCFGIRNMMMTMMIMTILVTLPVNYLFY